MHKQRHQIQAHAPLIPDCKAKVKMGWLEVRNQTSQGGGAASKLKAHTTVGEPPA